MNTVRVLKWMMLVALAASLQAYATHAQPATGCAMVAGDDAPGGEKKEGGEDGAKPDGGKPDAEKPRGEPVVDDKTARLLDAMEKQIYQLADRGLKKVSCKGEVNYHAPFASQTTKGSLQYYWDGSAATHNGVFKCNPEELGQLFDMGSTEMDLLAGHYRLTKWREEMKGCTISSAKSEQGNIIKVSGSAKNVTEIRLGKNGLPTDIFYSVREGNEKQDSSVALKYEKFDGKYALKEIKRDVPMKGQPVQVIMTIEYTKKNKYQVWSKQDTDIKMAGNSVGWIKVEFSDFQFNDSAVEIKQPEKQTPPPPPQHEYQDKYTMQPPPPGGAPPGGAAGAPTAPPPAAPAVEAAEAVADADATRCLDAMDAKEYHLADFGVKKLSFTGEIKTKSPMSPEAVTSTFDYFWDKSKTGQKGILRGDSPKAEGLLRQAGLSLERLANNFEQKGWREKMRGCTLTSEKSETGTHIKIEGSKEGVREFILGKNDLVTDIVLDVKQGMQQGKGKMALEYLELDGKFAVKKITMDMEIQGQKLHMVMESTFGKAGDYHVLSDYTSTLSMGAMVASSSTTTFRDYKFNDEAVELTPPVAAPKTPPPTTRPAAPQPAGPLPPQPQPPKQPVDPPPK